MLWHCSRLASLVAVAILFSACQRTFVDTVPTVTFNEHVYFVVAGDRFNLDRSFLTAVGTPSQSSLSDQDGSVYALKGINPAQVAVAFDGGHPVVLVERGLFRAFPTGGPEGGDPLAAALPSMCQYWHIPKPLECRAIPAPSG